MLKINTIGPVEMSFAHPDMIGWRGGPIVSDSRPSVAPQITPFPMGLVGLCPGGTK
jgi:hypothetical protein